jgi:hypothetical protein
MKNIFSIGESNGLFKWNFQGDRNDVQNPEKVFE